MAVTGVTRLLAASVFCFLTKADDAYNLPDVTIQVFKPKGFRASIPDAPNLALFVFQGNVNRKIDSDQVGELHGEVISATNGRWVVELPDVSLAVGDVINYHVFASVKSAGYLKDKQQFTVTTGAGNRKIDSDHVGELHGEVISATNVRWVVELPDGTLAVGDVINYHVLASVNSAGYLKDKQQFIVTRLEDYTPLTSPGSVPGCTPSVTRLRQGTACVGQTIFEENFDSLRSDRWQVQQYIPVEHPEHPFISYQRNVVTVENGNLRIVPSLQQNQAGFNADSMMGSLDLYKGCTSDTSSSCYVQGNDGSGIIPPVVTGRVTSKPGFAFTYGTVTVRAKLPQGDWLYPEILLEPLMKTFVFGSVNSGVIKIACARGNKELNSGSTHFGNKVLYSGPVIDTTCHDNLLNKKNSNTFWGDGFHDYSVKWTPDNLIFSVDGLEYGRVEPANNGLRDRLPQNCPAVQQSGMAPFDDHFYITLGLAVGGHTEFPDASVSKDGHNKPWRNQGSKAALKFWNDRDAWHSTWRQPELLVDYVKVVAL